MKVVSEIGCIHTRLFADNHPMESWMPLRRTKAHARGKIFHTDRIGRDQKKEHVCKAVVYVLNGMHGKSVSWSVNEITVV